jgi:putative spermidine/putrescine transport system ATP-binding protein
MMLAGGPGATSIIGKVDDSILLGGVVRHFVRCEDQSTIVIQELNQPGRQSAKRGAEVRAGWHPAHSRLLPATKKS